MIRWVGAVGLISVLVIEPVSFGAPVSWVGGDGLWHTAANWSSSPAIPGPSDDVTINQPGTITVTLGASAPLIHSLVMTENLLINMPVDLPVGAGGATLSGAITLNVGRLVSSSGAMLIQGTINNDLSGLKADAGGSIQFAPGVLPTVNGRADGTTDFEANGAGSLVDLSGVTTYNGGTFANSSLLAINGGKIEMENVPSITTGATFMEANGASSQILLSALTTFSRTAIPDSGQLRAFNGGVLTTPNLTTLGGNIFVEVGGATSSIGLGNVTNADTANFRASNAGVISLNSLTSYTTDGAGATFTADGVGSKLDISPLTTFNGGTFANAKLFANNGGLIEFENITSITNGATLIDATGTGAVVNLTALTTFGRTNLADTGRLRAAGGGTLLTPNLTTTGPINIELDGPTSSINLSKLASVDSTSFSAANGAIIAPPLLTSYSAGGTGSNILANGTGSVVDLSPITTFSGGSFNRTNVIATGGRIELDNVAEITAGATNVEANDGGRVVLTDLTTFAKTNLSDTARLRASNGGVIESPNLASSGRVNLEVSGPTSVIDLGSLTTASSTSFLASNGGVISAPALASYSADDSGSTIRSDHAGSLIDLSSVTSFAGGTVSNTDIYAVTGTIDLSGLVTMTSGGVDARATNSGRIDFSKLATFSPTNNADFKVLLVETGGTMQFHTTAKTTVSNTDMFLSAGGQMLGHEIELGASTTFQAAGTLDANLTNAAGSLRPGFNNQIGAMSIDGDFKQNAAGQLRIEASSVTQYDSLSVDGNMLLNGNLHVTPLTGFTPVYGTGIDIINATGTISGVFSSITWDGLFGWRAEYLPNVVRLIAQFGADFDEDGDVDGADLVVWQGNYGMSGAVHTDGDADDDGDVDGRDFLVWQRQFTGPGTIGAVTSVPEPRALLLLVNVCIACLMHRNRR